MTDFLGYARPLRPEMLSLRALLEHAVQVVAPRAKSHDIVVEVEVPSADIEISADGAKLDQVLLHLAQNAIDAIAGEARGGHITLRVRQQRDAATIEVEDTGPGIPPGTPIFDAFFSTKPNRPGLGLSISRGLAIDHGGALTVDSRPGCTIFRLSLPRTAAPTPSDATAAS